MLETQQPVGVILGGGRGLRIGGSKLTVALQGRPLMAYPLAAMREVLADVALIAKADVVLPALPGAMLWIEPDTPHNPLLGIVEALALAGGRPALVCPADIPFVTPALLAALAGCPDDGAPAVVASFHGTIRPLLGCYRFAAAAMLADAAHVAADAGHDEEFVRCAVAAIGPRLFDVADELELFDVDTPDDLLQAAAMLDANRRARVSDPGT